MDTLTHALSGALSARATAPRTGALPLRRRVGIGFVVAALPDLDVVGTWVSPLFYLEHHRGVTHSLLMLPIWTVLLALPLSRLWRGGPGWRAYAGVVALALFVHIVGDWLTSFGTMVFAPLSDARFALGTTFIIDLWFSGIILAGLLASLLWRRTRVPAIVGTLVLAGYVGLQAVARDHALEFAEGYAQAQGMTDASVTASPRPVSPFNWTLIVVDGETLHLSHVNVLRDDLLTLTPEAGFLRRLDAPYQPLESATWQTVSRFGEDGVRDLAREAWSQPELGFFRWFAQHPVLYRVDNGRDSVCAWFQDLRFLTPGRDAMPFRYGLCRAGNSAWRRFQLLEDGAALPLN